MKNYLKMFIGCIVSLLLFIGCNNVSKSDYEKVNDNGDYIMAWSIANVKPV